MVHQDSVMNVKLWVCFAELLYAVVNVATAGGHERDYGFAFKVSGFDEGIDNSGVGVPPVGISDEYHFILREIGQFAGNGGAGFGVFHLNGATALFICPVKVGFCVDHFGFDFVKGSAGFISNFFCSFGSGSGGREVADDCVRWLLIGFYGFFLVVVRTACGQSGCCHKGEH